jgi:hypothetical protein
MVPAHSTLLYMAASLHRPETIDLARRCGLPWLPRSLQWLGPHGDRATSAVGTGACSRTSTAIRPARVASAPPASIDPARVRPCLVTPPLPRGHAGPTAWRQRLYRWVMPVPRPGSSAATDGSRRYLGLAPVPLSMSHAGTTTWGWRLSIVPAQRRRDALLASRHCRPPPSLDACSPSRRGSPTPRERLCRPEGEACPAPPRGSVTSPERFGCLSREVRLPLPRGYIGSI